MRNIKAEVIYTDDVGFHNRKGDLAMPDMDVDIPGIGSVTMRQVEKLQVSYMPNNPSDKITIGLITATVTPDGEHDGAGFIYALSPEEALIVIDSLQRLLANPPQVEAAN